MRVAVLSDIHANRQAFEAVLADVASTSVDELWCLGDIVGYGADPNACVELARSHAAVCLAGNHDLAVTGGLSLDEFSRGRRGRSALDQRGDRARPARLSVVARAGAGRSTGIGLYHGSPRDPVWEYVLSALLAELCFDSVAERIVLIGHSHVALSFVRREGEIATGERREAGDEVDIRRGEWLLNPGSVGQPRDGDPRAAWLLLDTDALTASWRRVEYDVAGAAAAIRQARLPDSLAERLGYGQ